MTRFFIITLIVILFIGCGKNEEKEENMTIAAKLFRKLNSNDLQKQIDIMQDVGVRQLYVFPEQVKIDEADKILDKSGIELWLIAPIFYNDENQNLSPAPKWAICNDGEIAQEKSQNGNWLKMVCPNDTEYLDYRICYLEDALSLCNFTGISLDFIRYFVFWEGVFEDTPSETLRNSCFCDICVDRFKEYSQILEIQGNNIKDRATGIKRNYFDKWTEFKCVTINEDVKRIVSKLRQKNPYIKVNLHAVPWTKNDFDGSIKSIAGQDFSLLSNNLEQLSPMTYSKMLRKNGQWINDLIKSLYEECGGKLSVIPAIQCKSVYGEEFNDDDFEDILKNAVKSPSSGAAIWPFEDLSDKQIDIVKGVIREIRK